MHTPHGASAGKRMAPDGIHRGRLRGQHLCRCLQAYVGAPSSTLHTRATTSASRRLSAYDSINTPARVPTQLVVSVLPRARRCAQLERPVLQPTSRAQTDARCLQAYGCAVTEWRCSGASCIRGARLRSVANVATGVQLIV
jgi:hypothetical protein